MKRLLSLWLCAVMTMGAPSLTAHAAPQWPEDVQVEADGAILMDANTGTVLYEKRSEEKFYPASITKILTALVVIENCKDLDETVTFSYNAIFDVEPGSSNMGAQVGDQLSVRDCLYGLMLASANEAGNALAEHIAESKDAFVQMMNDKAAELGCTGSNFANPSGLNNENHYTTAYDMALITQAAIQNKTLMEIIGTTAWTHGPIKRYPDPAAPENTVYNHHQMLRKSSPNFYPGAFGGKTGYTTLAGNTLVTCAERNGIRLIAVILNGHKTHYSDTKKMLDFGFNQFQSLRVAEHETSFDRLKNNFTIAGLPATRFADLVINPEATIILPKEASFSDAAYQISYDLTPADPPAAIARIHYQYNNRDVGTAYLVSSMADTSQTDMATAVLPSLAELISDNETNLTEAPPTEASAINDSLESNSESSSSEKKTWFTFPEIKISSKLLMIAGILVSAAAAVLLTLYLIERSRRRELARKRRLRERRNARLRDLGYSTEDFNLMMEQKSQTTSHPPVHTSHRKKRRR